MTGSNLLIHVITKGIEMDTSVIPNNKTLPRSGFQKRG